MQRSRRALLRRRALEKALGRNLLFKISITLVIALWGLVFLLNLWISHGDHEQDEHLSLAVNSSAWDEDKFYRSRVCAEKHSIDSLLEQLTESHSVFAHGSLDTASPIIENISSEVQINRENATAAAVAEELDHVEDLKLEKDMQKSDRLTYAVTLGLDEFKSKAMNSLSKPVSGTAGNVVHRLEPGGAKYNYASSAKGAKVLAFNKEAKGASNILEKDKDKYLRNPCSVEEKFVVIELSEETLVDTVEIANFEHYSSNVRDIGILGSSVYPTDTWVHLGNFTAGNVKHAQEFTLSEAKWVRYLKLNLLNHYGSEFYCTLSSFEVYGVDAIERMLVDLISVPDNHFVTTETTPTLQPVKQTDSDQDLLNGSESLLISQSSSVKQESTSTYVLDSLQEVRHQQVSRMPGDTVLKILMQKVRALDLNLSVLERYIEELNIRYGTVFKDFDQEIDENDLVLQKIRSDIKDLLSGMKVMTNDVDELASWKPVVSLQLDGLFKDNMVLRSEVSKVVENQRYMESKCTIVFLTSFVSFFVALVMLFMDKASSVYRSEKTRKFCWVYSSWILLLFSCCTTLFVLSL